MLKKILCLLLIMFSCWILPAQRKTQL